ncbi:phosphotransferase family protein [Flavisphingomonas formosensis]|uniref:phosphotransferase family protein n=1 Tax=Flavisphingomonas formosensis TaxID=861534 RepID=UPI001E4EB40A|nr:phosphotransferase family protein [Sphingomonas formosensis]
MNDVAEQKAPNAYLGASGEMLSGFEIDPAALAGFLRERDVDGGEGIVIRQFQGGQSNPTYLVRTDAAAYVLRRRPPGVLLASAHAIDREYRIISALHAAGLPVPRPIAYCDDTAVIGSAFYLMAHVEGRIFFDNSLPDLAPEERAAVYDSANATLARLHALDPAALGLEDFGRPGNYLARQVARWSRQYEASKTIEVPAMDKVIAWLAANVPPEVPARIVHGDYSLHNLIFRPDRPEVAAIIDWELATLGDPIADLTYHAMEWYRPPGIDPRGSLAAADLDRLGIPPLDAYVARYCARIGRGPIADLGYYKAFNLFRVAAIIQGVVARQQGGNAVDPQAVEQAARVAPLAEAAWAAACEAGATDTHAKMDSSI